MAGGSIVFYEAAAQLIPVMVLVLVVEQRSGETLESPLGNLVFVLSTFLAAAIGEMVALHELYRGRAAPSDQYWVTIPMGLVALSLVAPIVFRSLRTIGTEATERTKALASIALLTTCFAVAVFAFAATRY